MRGIESAWARWLGIDKRGPHRGERPSLLLQAEAAMSLRQLRTEVKVTIHASAYLIRLIREHLYHIGLHSHCALCAMKYAHHQGYP
jgi:hypothetical protein